ncbi:hypothetical protein BJX70DRAFT_355941 [Aspergillus crustosus]
MAQSPRYVNWWGEGQVLQDWPDIAEGYDYGLEPPVAPLQYILESQVWKQRNENLVALANDPRRPMSPYRYKTKVSTLRDKHNQTGIKRISGSMTLDDPLAIWLCEAKDRPAGRVDGIERLGRQVSR